MRLRGELFYWGTGLDWVRREWIRTTVMGELDGDLVAALTARARALTCDMALDNKFCGLEMCG